MFWPQNCNMVEYEAVSYNIRSHVGRTRKRAKKKGAKGIKKSNIVSLFKYKLRNGEPQ